MKNALAAIAVVALVLLISSMRGRPALNEAPVIIEPITGLAPLDASPGLAGAPVAAPAPPRPEIRYVDPATRVHPDDINQALARLVDELLGVLEPGKKPLVFAARSLENSAGLTPEKARIVWEKLGTVLLRSGRVRLASSGPIQAELKALRAEIEDSGLYARPAKKARPAAPRYLLRGRLVSGAEAEKPQDQTFTLELSLDTIETAETLWSGEAAVLETLIR